MRFPAIGRDILRSMWVLVIETTAVVLDAETTDQLLKRLSTHPTLFSLIGKRERFHYFDVDFKLFTIFVAALIVVGWHTTLQRLILLGC